MKNPIQIEMLSRKNTVKEDNSRCSQCGYILYTEDTNEEQIRLDFTARSQFLDKDKQNKQKNWSNQTDCTALRLFGELVLPVPDINILLFLTECAKYKFRYRYR